MSREVTREEELKLDIFHYMMDAYYLDLSTWVAALSVCVRSDNDIGKEMLRVLLKLTNHFHYDTEARLFLIDNIENILGEEDQEEMDNILRVFVEDNDDSVRESLAINASDKVKLELFKNELDRMFCEKSKNLIYLLLEYGSEELKSKMISETDNSEVLKIIAKHPAAENKLLIEKRIETLLKKYEKLYKDTKTKLYELDIAKAFQE